MSKNVTVNGTNYSGVSEVQLNTTAGGTAKFKDVDEITTPSGTKTITENGTYDVTNYASAVVNVEGGGESTGGISIDEIATGTQPSGEITITSSTIAEFAFYKKTAITKAIINKSNYAQGNSFNGCTALKEVIFESATSCAGYAFRDCTGLEKVTWKATPTNIATTAFNGCNALTDIYVPWSEDDEITNVTTTAPWGAENATIHYNS